jgi:cytochrome c oxidase subunit 2
MATIFRSSKIAFTVAFLSIFLSSAFSEDNAAGKTIYQTCTACHGANAEGNIAFKSPNLTGIDKWYFSAQIKKYQTGARGAHADDTAGKLMAPMAQLLKTDKDIEAVFNYIQTIKKDIEIKPTLGGDATKGKTLYTTCLACHGDKGQGNEALKAPSFKKQEDWYIYEQLVKYKKDIRGADAKDAEGKLMGPMAKTLADDAAIKDVAAYILTLK